jgi:hypothetical protein
MNEPRYIPSAAPHPDAQPRECERCWELRYPFEFAGWEVAVCDRCRAAESLAVRSSIFPQPPPR